MQLAREMPALVFLRLDAFAGKPPVVGEQLFGLLFQRAPMR